jgi:PKD repeat protein
MQRGVQFRSRSSGAPDTVTWDFGDGTPTSAAAAPVHAYATPGFYTVTLAVSGPLGTDTRTRTEYVHVLDAVTPTFTSTKDASSAPTQTPAVDVPFAMPVVGAIDAADPGSFLLFDLSSEGSTEFPDEFEWTLRRNGGGATVVSRVADPEDVRIAATGSYDLTLAATGPGGAGTATQRIDVFQGVEAAFSTSPAGPIVRGPANLQVQFTDATSGDVVDPAGRFYEFGDGATSAETDPVHTYAEGLYFAKLTVTGKGGDSDQTANLAVIADGTITAAFQIAPQPAGSLAGVISGEAIDPSGGVLVDFVNESQHALGTPLFFRWDFGLGGATGQEAVEDPTGIPYALASAEDVQSFLVSLVTSTTNPAPPACFGQPAGTCDERIGVLTVFPRPQVGFAPPGASFASAPLRPPHTVQLAGTVVGDGLGTDPVYRWLRSPVNQTGATIVFATGLAPLFEFPDPGVYEVVLEVETNAPGGTRQSVQSTPQDVSVTAATFSDWYMQAIAPASGARCTNCHKGANPPAGLNWLGTPAEVFERIVEDAGGNPILSTRCNQSRRRIAPFDPENSAVYNVLLKPPGPLCEITMRVNLPGDEADKDAHVAKLRSWIMGGALND